VAEGKKKKVKLPIEIKGGEKEKKKPEVFSLPLLQAGGEERRRME